MGYKVDNAIIMAAGYSSRFAPISYETPKALINVKGEILIERQINQLKQAGINEIIVVVGYKKEKFDYLKEKFNIILIENKEYSTKNNHASIYVAKDYLKNTYICSSDNYFTENPFESEVDESYYASVYAEGYTNEWCMQVDKNDWVTNVTIGGSDSWYMLGHAFWSEDYSKKFLSLLEKEYGLNTTKDKYWENIYAEHLDELKMKIRRYDSDVIHEFDSLSELREFDKKYVNHSGSTIMENIACFFKCEEREIIEISPLKNSYGEVEGFGFKIKDKEYKYIYEAKCLQEV